MDSHAYWIERTQRAAARAYNSQEKRTAVFLKAYRDAYEAMEREVAALYAKAARGDKLTLTELYKYQRYEKFMNEVSGICDELAGQERRFAKASFTRLLKTSYADIGQLFGAEFTTLPKKTIDTMLQYPWSGANYSQLVWENRDLLVRNARKTIVRGAVRGDSVTSMTRELRKKVESSAYNARRLIRTESMHFIHQGHLVAYRELGIDQVEIIVAEDERTCDECMAHNGEILSVEEADLYLPVHPQCRCTFAPVLNR